MSTFQVLSLVMLIMALVYAVCRFVYRKILVKELMADIKRDFYSQSQEIQGRAIELLNSADPSDYEANDTNHSLDELIEIEIDSIKISGDWRVYEMGREFQEAILTAKHEATWFKES